jgi:predicted O-methyltransferase YrrM
MEEPKGLRFRICDSWSTLLPKFEGPIRYLEVGSLCGVNAVYFERLFAPHPDSRLYCIDAWELLDDPKFRYKENYEQTKNYRDYCSNIVATGKAEKFVTIKGFSFNEVPKLENESFDVIYVDANHDTDYTLEDTLLSWRKLKSGGYMIFDDYQCPDTRLAIDMFRMAFKSKIKELGLSNCQFFIQKL